MLLIRDNKCMYSTNVIAYALLREGEGTKAYEPKEQMVSSRRLIKPRRE